MALCNESKLTYDSKNHQVKPAGLPTEAALRVLLEKMGRYDAKAMPTLSNDVDAYNAYLTKDKPIQVNLEFTRDRKAMSVLVND